MKNNINQILNVSQSVPLVWKIKQSHALVSGLKLPKFRQLSGCAVVFVVVTIVVVIVVVIIVVIVDVVVSVEQ